MSYLLLIDDDLNLIAKQVRRAFPDHRVETAGTAAEGLHRLRADPPTSFSSTCVCLTSRGWKFTNRSASSMRGFP